MCAGFDVGSRPEAGDRIDTVAEASIERKAGNGGEAKRNCVELRTTSPAMRGAEAHAHGNVPGRVFECVENTRHSLRTDLLRGAAQSQAGFDRSPIAENRSGHATRP